MLTINAVENILNTFPISIDIQKKILLLFLSCGTPSANIIKQECLKLYTINHYNYIEDSKTLWRLKLYNNNYKILVYNPSLIISIAQIELSIAAINSFQPSNQETYNCMYKITFAGLTTNHLYFMFYNLDKFDYGVYGTPTANIIRKTFV